MHCNISRVDIRRGISHLRSLCESYSSKSDVLAYPAHLSYCVLIVVKALILRSCTAKRGEISDIVCKELKASDTEIYESGK